MIAMNRLLDLNPAPFRHPSPVVGPLAHKAHELAKSRVKILKGNIGDAARMYPPSRIVIEAGISRLSDISHFRYSETKGMPALRAKIAEIERVSSEDVFVGNGASEIMQMLALTFAGKNHNILLPSPCFFPYFVWSDFLNIEEVHLEPRMYACDIDNGWQPDLEDLEKKIDNNTRAVVLINPNNPTGWVASEEFLHIFSQLIENTNTERAHAGIPPITLISDEVYRDVVFDGHTKSMWDIVDVSKTNLVVLNSSSKSARLSGPRVGYAAVSGPAKHEIIESLFNQAGNRLAANSLGQVFYLESIKQNHPGLKEMNASLKQASDIVCEEFSKSKNLKFVRPRGAFYMFIKVESNRWSNSAEFCNELLEKKHVLVSPGEGFLGKIQHPKLDGIFFRLVYLLPEDELRLLSQQIVDFVR